MKNKFLEFVLGIPNESDSILTNGNLIRSEEFPWLLGPHNMSVDDLKLKESQKPASQYLDNKKYDSGIKDFSAETLSDGTKVITATLVTQYTEVPRKPLPRLASLLQDIGLIDLAPEQKSQYQRDNPEEHEIIARKA